VAESCPVDLDLLGLHAISVAADIRSRNGYRLGMAQQAAASSDHAIARLADSG